MTYATVGVEKLPVHYLFWNGDYGPASLWKSKESDRLLIVDFNNV